MGVIDAFFHAHNHHRRNMDNPGNFGDCMKGRICFMTAIALAFVHAYQLPCLAERLPWSHIRNFACPLPEPDIRICPTVRPQHAKEAMIFKVGPSTLTGALAWLTVKL